jgi:hypothetical protein
VFAAGSLDVGVTTAVCGLAFERRRVVTEESISGFATQTKQWPKISCGFVPQCEPNLQHFRNRRQNNTFRYY